MSKIKRYRCAVVTLHPSEISEKNSHLWTSEEGMFEVVDGEWVKYEDVKHLIECGEVERENNKYPLRIEMLYSDVEKFSKKDKKEVDCKSDED